MKHLLFIFILVISFATGYTQSLPLNTCGVVYTHDAAGNRTQRIYLCNNGLRETTVQENENRENEAVQVTALYPNPTTGQFRVTFTKALQQAQVTFIDLGGHVVQQRTVNGNLVNFDISSFPAGMYWIKITDGDNRLMYKVIKQ
jgi:hypothetical protein